VYAVAPVVLFFCLALLSTRIVTYNVFGRDDRRTMVRRRRIPCLVAGGLALVIALAPIQRGVASVYALRLGGLETAVKAERLSVAVTLDPGNDMYWNLLGAAYAGALAGGVTGPVTDAARSAFTRAQKLAPADYRAWWSQGMMELNLKSPAALTCLQEAERLYPTLAGLKGWVALAMVYVDGDVAGAEAKAAEAVAIVPGEPYAVVAQAFCALTRGETARAKDLLTGIVKLGFTNKFAYYGLSLCYRAVGDTAMERTELVYSQRINPNLVEAMARLRDLSP